MNQADISAGLQSNKAYHSNLLLQQVMLAKAEGGLVFKDLDMDMVDLMLLFTWGMEC
jgi:hypothetical protein